MFSSCVCCGLTGSDPCNELITRSVELCRVCVCVCVFNCVRFRNMNNEAVCARFGLLRHRKKDIM